MNSFINRFSLIIMSERLRQPVKNSLPKALFHILGISYKFIALAPKTPAKAEATAITTFRIISHTDFFIAIIYLLSVL